MIYKFSLKGIDNLSTPLYKQVDPYLNKINRYLPQLADDPPYLNIVMKKGTDKLLPIKGTLSLKMPGKVLIVSLSAGSIESLLKNGFERLIRGLKERGKL
ncbi:hypothetical protein HYS97_03425 [Candidatus Daviesbacteria bacterium]|nr:hypothetical protein [Candidatus Daviesbacteria bacterium]